MRGVPPELVPVEILVHSVSEPLRLDLPPSPLRKSPVDDVSVRIGKLLSQVAYIAYPNITKFIEKCDNKRDDLITFEWVVLFELLLDQLLLDLLAVAVPVQEKVERAPEMF